MRERLIARARQREQRDRQFTDPDEVVSLVNAAGFDIVSCVPASGELAKPADALLATIFQTPFHADCRTKVRRVIARMS